MAAGMCVPAVAVPAAAAPGGRAPDRVHVLMARTTAHTADVKWSPATTGPHPTGYQVRVASRKWKSTKKTQYRIQGLAPDHTYRISIRAVRRGKAGKAVVIQAFTHG